MKKICILILVVGFIFPEYEYSLQDYNSTSESYGLDIWDPIYSDYITLHYFSSQGWAGWTATFGQLSDFQDELRNLDGYEKIVIIAVGQSNISSFNDSYCSNSNLPLVQDEYPDFPIRAMFNANDVGYFKQVVILDYNRNIIGEITLTEGLTNAASTYIKDIIGDNYQQSILGDVNNDSIVNVQDIIIFVNMILNNQTDSSADLNSDGIVNILDVVQVVNIILD